MNANRSYLLTCAGYALAALGFLALLVICLSFLDALVFGHNWIASYLVAFK